MLISGRIPGMARASKVFPDPGDPAISTLWAKSRTFFSRNISQNLAFTIFTLATLDLTNGKVYFESNFIYRWQTLVKPTIKQRIPLEKKGKSDKT
jgi:hypothetical protein